MVNDFEELNEGLLISQAGQIALFGDSNLAQLNGIAQERDLMQDYYLGMIRRQVILLHDLQTLIAHSEHHNLSGVLILCRCLLDDFLHVFFLKQHNEEEENLVKINADEYKQMFRSVDVIMQSNHQHFEGQNPYYITEDEFAAVKAHFIGQEENDKYFIDKAAFRFKRFKTVADLVLEFNDFEMSKMAQRAFYFWKDLSGFVHYSNITFEKEINEDNLPYNLSLIEEVLLYSYNTIELSFRYFHTPYGLELIIDPALHYRFAIHYH
jgi:hypothetical protein